MKARYFIVTIGFCASSFSCKQTESSTPPAFKIQAGYNLSLIASEPLIKDPVDIEFDEQGNTYVLEMPGYPLEDKQSYIVSLRDKDQDGIYDEVKTVAQDLNMATSILPFKKGFLVASPPYLFHIKDLNGDEIFEDRDTIMGGFSTGNLQHNYNGLMMGLDGWIYAANGGNSGNPFWWGDTTSKISLRSRDFRFHLAEKKLERLGRSSGGFGFAMNEWGHIFETHNLHHISHLVFPERYHQNINLSVEHALENISDHEENGLARIYPIGEQESRVNHPEQSGYFSGACGVTYYGGGAMGDKMDQSIWVADVVLNLIHIDKLKRQTSSYTATRLYQNTDFIASSDRSFRPVNMMVGPDGAMYLLDMYRQVIEHPEWIPDEMEKTMDLKAGTDQGRIYKIKASNHPGHKIDYTIFKTPSTRISALQHPNQWVRNTAHRLLLEESLTELSIHALKVWCNSTSNLAKVHALWILHANKKLDMDILVKALHDQSSNIREQALLIAESSMTDQDTVLVACADLLEDEDARVRMQAALTLSILSEIAFNKHKTLLLNKIQASALKENDKWNTVAISLAAKHAPAQLFKFLIDHSSNVQSLFNSLAWISGNKLEQSESILEILRISNLDENGTCSILQNLTSGIVDLNPSNKLLSSIKSLEQKGSSGVISKLALLRKKLQLPLSTPFEQFSKAALNEVNNTNLSDSARLAALQLIELLPYGTKSEALYKCLDHAEPISLQEGALKQLSTFDEPIIGHKLIERWNSLGPHIRRYAGDLLLYKKIHHDALLDGLEQKIINIGEMNFDLERRRTLLWWSNNEDTKRRAEALFSDEGVTTRLDALEKMKPALSLTGTSSKGKIIFQNLCSQCHIYGDIGKEVGPVLTEINRKSRATLLHDIIDPNASTDTKYINHKIEKKSGEVYLGMIDQETDDLVILKQMNGATVTINKSEIKSLNSLGTSLMMEGLENNMSPQDMADLLVYLQQGK